MSDRYIVMDVETSGLADFSKPADAEGQPRLAHLALIYLDSEFNVERDYDVLIKPDGWTLEAGAAAVNGLTCERLLADGIPVVDALLEYTKAVETGRVVVAFNAVFDTKVMRGELRRAGMDDMFMKTRNICVMRAMTDVCQIPYANDRAGFKFPKLAEALAHIGSMSFTEDAHTAMADARGALEIMRWLAKNQMLSEPGIHLAKKRPDLVPTPPRRSAAKAPPALATDEIPQ
jgi:DNA polymerase III epsilon subunit-like protein